jgi:hypothetical protein
MRSLAVVYDANLQSILSLPTRQTWRGFPTPRFWPLAAAEGRILVTSDLKTMPRHFGEFLMSRESSPGLFLVSQYTSIREVIDDLVLIWAASDAEEWNNRIVKIPQS